jgi:two-component system, cell cycle response regulator
VGKIEVALGDLEILLVTLVGAVGLSVRLDGGFDGPSYAGVYLVMGIAAAVARPAATVGGILGLAALEATGRTLGARHADLTPLFWHLAFSTVFAALNHVLLRAEIMRLRSKAKARVGAELDRLHDAARRYRLLGAPRGTMTGQSARADEERLARSSVEEIHQAVLFSLDLVRRSMNLHTAMLLWLNDSGSHLRIAELSTDGEVLDGPFLAGDGVLGAALARKAAVSLGNLRAGYKLPYYGASCPVGSVCVVPVLDHGELRGLMVADRVDGQGFTAKEEEVLLSATRHAVRAIQNERVFIQLERAKVEQGKLYRAAEALGGAVGEADVVEAAVKSAREIAAFDFAAVTLYDPKDNTHEIRAVSGDGAEPLLGARFAQNSGLVAMVVQNRHPLPYKGEIEEKRQVVFNARLQMPPVASVLVLPLMVHERPLGTLVLGARRRGVFGDAVRPTLEVLARHVAVSLANARMVKKLEDLATTDGLTGLLNKRALLESADLKISASKRFGRKMSVLITDIDFFKRVNDTYGHDVGDVVIKGLGEILKRVKRTTDSVARFGGEEFVILCEETDAKGGLLLAERIREELGKTVFSTPNGPLRVTCSLGVSTYPEAGRDWESLFKAADEALYVSKHGGRDRSTVWSASSRRSATSHGAPSGSVPASRPSGGQANPSSSAA